VVRMVDWFLHADPRVAARITRWGVRGVAALSIPLLLVLLFREQWTAATALAAAIVLVLAVVGRHLWRLVGVLPLAGRAPSSMGATARSFADEAELVRYSAAVLEAYMRRTAAVQTAADVPAIADQTGGHSCADDHGRAGRKGRGRGDNANGNGHAGGISNAKRIGDAAAGNGHAESFGLGAMSEEEACAVLGVDRGASETEIRAVHGRISAMVAPARGGSPYLAIKVDQAKEVLVRAAAQSSADAPPRAPRKRGASRRRPFPPA
jgi:hypothetical protein